MPKKGFKATKDKSRKVKKSEKVVDTSIFDKENSTNADLLESLKVVYKNVVENHNR